MAGSGGLMLADAKVPTKAEQDKSKEKAKTPAPPGTAAVASQRERGSPQRRLRESQGEAAAEEASPAGLASLFAGGAQTRLTFHFAVNHKTAEELVRESLRGTRSTSTPRHSS